MSGTPTTYLLAIAIGPVQDFIAASRKARDLWQGSDMLSKLSRAAAESLRKGGAELIFPTSASLQANHAVANKLLVSTTGIPRDLAAAARLAVQAALTGMWGEVLPTIRKLPAGSVDAGIDGESGLARDQRDDFVEWYAAWVPYDPDIEKGPGSYQDARARVERLLAGRKTLREFQPAAGVDLRPKSSLDPSRESIVDHHHALDPRAVRRLRLKGAEQLDAVSLIKRLNKEARFISTSRVAIDPFIRAADVSGAKGRALLKNLKKSAGRLSRTDLAERFEPVSRFGLDRYAAFPFDSQLFYDPTVESAMKQLAAWQGTREYTRLEREATRFFDNLTSLRHEVKGMGELPAYYAVLRADGDQMGKAIGALKTKKDHQTLSTHLGDFATEAGDIVRDHFGAMIYSGGDDVLAFLPLDTALPCADALRLKFSKIMGTALPEMAEVDRPTLSAGIAIGHYAEHLQTMLERAGEAEHAAKDGGRNALAVSFQAHSGGGDPRTVVHQWSDDPVRKQWATAVEFHRHDTLPDGAIYELDALRREFADAHENGVFGGTFDRALSDEENRAHKEQAERAMNDLLVKETVRILKRKRVSGGTKAVQDTVIAKVRTSLESPPPSKTALVPLGAFVDEVIIARRIARLLPNSATTGLPLWKGALIDVQTTSIEDESTSEQTIDMEVPA